MLKLLFLIPLIIFVNPAFAETAEIQMDWIIEGQIDKEIVSDQQAEIVSNYEELVVEEKKTQKPVYHKFITNNEYAMGDYKITIDSEEGQMLNGMLIEQRNLQEDSFMHKIKYFDRFSDGYVEIAEALLDPIGDSKYVINGRSLDYNPNSNLELFVLERGYSMDNLEAIPNDVFSPKEFTLGRQLMKDAIDSGEGEFDLREYSPNYLLLNQEQIQEKMMESLSEQTSQIFTGIMSGEELTQRELQSKEIETSQSSKNFGSIFDNFKFEQPKFENTRHVRDSLQSKPFQVIQPSQELEDISLLMLVPVIVGLAIFGYFMRKKLFERKTEESLLQIAQPQVDYRKLTKDMLDKSRDLYENNQRKEAHEILSQAIRYYYSQNLKIYKEMTNFELLANLRQIGMNDYDQVRNWLLLCGSVEYAKYKTNDQEFRNALDEFLKEVS